MYNMHPSACSILTVSLPAEFVYSSPLIVTSFTEVKTATLKDLLVSEGRLLS